MRTTLIRAALGALLIVSATGGFAQDRPAVGPPTDRTVAAVDELVAIQAFEARVADYVTMHRRLEGPLPPLQVSTDMEVVRQAMEALATRIRQARSGARQGDFFRDDVAPVFRRRVVAAISPEDMDAILAEHEPGDPAPAPLEVNAFWPEGTPFDFVPPRLIAALPPLPPELQYRIIGRSLVLWDHHANLIVDFLPGALTS